MPLLTKVGSFVKRGTTGTQAVTGVGFTPKAIIFWTTTSNQDSGVWGIFYNAVIGYTAGPSNSYSMCAASSDAVSPTDTTRRTAAKAITMSYRESVTDEADLSSFDADGFTLNWTTANGATWGNNVQFNYMALGGSDLTGAKVVLWDGAQQATRSVTGVGFRPDLVFHASTMQFVTPIPTNDTFAIFGIGAMNRAGEQWANSWTAADGQSVANSSRWQRNDSCLLNVEFNEGIYQRATLKSMDADGFSVNFPTFYPTFTVGIISLCLQGVQSRLGSFQKPEAAAPVTQSFAINDFIPRAAFTTGILADNLAQTPTTSAHWLLGASDGTSQRTSVLQDRDAVTPTQADSAWFNDSAFATGFGETPTTRTKASATLTSNRFDLTFNPNGAGAEQILYMVLGEKFTDIKHPTYTPAAAETPPIRTAILADAPYAYWPLSDQRRFLVTETFDPASISGLVARLNPGALGLANNASVTSAPAVGSGPAWFVASGISAPIYKTGGLNGRPYLHTEHLNSGAYRSLTCDVDLRGANTTIIVARQRGSNNGRVLSGYRNNWLLGWHGNREDRAYFEGWFYGETPVALGPLSTTNLIAYTGIFTNTGGNDSIVYRNGVKVIERSEGAQGPYGLVAGGGFQIASGGNPNEHSDADIYEVLAWNRVLTNAELANVHDYIGLRYGTHVRTQLEVTFADASGNGRAAVPVGAPVRGRRGLNNRGFSVGLTRSSYSPIQAPFSVQWPEFTLEVFIRPEGPATTGTIVSKSGLNAQSVTDFPISVRHLDDGRFQMILSSGDDFLADATINTTRTYARDQSHHVVAVVRNNGACEIYVNGLLDGTATIAFALSTNTRNWTLGATPLEAVGSIGSNNANRALAGDATTIDGETVRLTRAVNSLSGAVALTTPVTVGAYFRIEFQTDINGGNNADGISFHINPLSNGGTPLTSFGPAGGGFAAMFLTYNLNPTPAGYRVIGRTGPTSSAQVHAEGNLIQTTALRGVHNWVYTFTRVSDNVYDMNVTLDGAAYVTNYRVGVPESGYINFMAATGGANDQHFVRNLRMSSDAVRFNGAAQHWAIYDKALSAERIQAHARTLVAVPPAGTLAHDSFNRANSTSTLGVADSGQTWLAVTTGGTNSTDNWRIVNNVAIDTNAGAGERYALLPVAATAYMKARVAALPGPGADGGLVIRSDNTGLNFLLLNIETTGYALYRRVGGTYTQIASLGGRPTVGDVLRLGASGDQIRVQINDDPARTFTETAHATQTHIGFRSAGAQTNGHTLAFDDLLVEATPGTTPNAPAVRTTSAVTTSTASNSLALTVPSGVQDNDVLVAAVMYQSTTQVLNLRYTSNGGANPYYYMALTNVPSYTPASGDTLEYEMFVVGTGRFGVDLEFTGGAVLRGAGLTDQHGRLAHPSEGANPQNVWIFRRISLTSFAGSAITTYWLAGEEDIAGTYAGRFRNLVIRGSNGVIKHTIWAGGALPTTGSTLNNLASATLSLQPEMDGEEIVPGEWAVVSQTPNVGSLRVALLTRRTVASEAGQSLTITFSKALAVASGSVAAYSGVDIRAAALPVTTAASRTNTLSFPTGVRVETFVGPGTTTATFDPSPTTRAGMDALYLAPAIPVSDGFVANIYERYTAVDARFGENVRKRWTGLIYLNAPGVWELGFDSDDAGDLDVEGKPVVSFYAGRGVTTDVGLNFGNFTVTQPGWHRFRLRVQNSGGPGGAVMGYRSPYMIAAGAGAALVPASMFGQSPLTEPGAVRITGVGTPVADIVRPTGAINRTAPGYVPVVLADEPAGYWRLDTTADTSVNNRALSLSGTAPLAAAILSAPDAVQSRTFNNSAFFSVGSSPLYNTSTGLTVLAWIRIPPGAHGSLFHAILSKQSGGAGVGGTRDYNFYVWSTNNNNTLDALHFSSTVAGGFGSSNVTGTPVLNDGNVHMVAVTYTPSDGGHRYYVDGVQVGTSIQSVNGVASSPYSLLIGAADNYMFGDMSDVALFMKTLSAERIAAHWAAGRATGAASRATLLEGGGDGTSITTTGTGIGAVQAYLRRQRNMLRAFWE